MHSCKHWRSGFHSETVLRNDIADQRIQFFNIAHAAAQHYHIRI